MLDRNVRFALQHPIFTPEFCNGRFGQLAALIGSVHRSQMRTTIQALAITLMLSGCDASCGDDREHDPDNPPIDIPAPDGRHIARVGVADCSGFRVDTVGRVRIRAGGDSPWSGTVVFQSPFAFSHVTWVDANHLSITLDDKRAANVALHEAEGIEIEYR